jgi:SagB-type dehydrogenase family enzyme
MDRPAKGPASNGTAHEEVPPDLLMSPSELYHENSKLHPEDLALYSWLQFVNTSPAVRQLISRPLTRFRGYPVIPLTEARPDPSCSLTRVLSARRSVRGFSGAPIPLSTLARILHLGDGRVVSQESEDGTMWGLRTAPSGGGLYPIDLYCAVMRVEGLAPGVYHYDVSRHALQLLRQEDPTEAMAEGTALGSAMREACVCILMGALFTRSKFKYGERAYRFVLLEAGHIGQNLLLAAESEGLGGVPIGGFMDDRINALLGFDGVEEAVVYLTAIGARA